jgi:hypothetical protein
VIARLDLTGIAISTRLSIIIERSRFGDELECVRSREVNYLFRLVACQVVLGKLSAEAITPGNVNERLNRGWSKNTFEGPRLSSTTSGIFFDQAVNAGIVVSLRVVLSVASVFTGDESDKTSF